MAAWSGGGENFQSEKLTVRGRPLACGPGAPWAVQSQAERTAEEGALSCHSHRLGLPLA